MTEIERLIAGLQIAKEYVKDISTYNSSMMLTLRCSQLSNEHEKKLQTLGFEIGFHDLPPDECYVFFEGSTS